MLRKSSNFNPLNPFAMKSPLLLLAVAALVISSCTSAYKTGQTPDDVYYSPVRPGGGASDEYVRAENNDDRRYHGSDEYYEDRYLRMRVQNRSRWSTLDDYYFNSPYAYNYNFYGYNTYSSWSNPYNSYWCWNNYYNPYYSGVIVSKNPKAYLPPPSRPVAFNGSSYKSTQNGNFRPSASRVSNSYSPSGATRYNNRNSNGNSFGNTLKKVFSNSNNNSSYQSGSSSTPSRSYNPSSSSSSSSSSRSSSSSSSSSSGSSSGGSRPAR